MSNPTVVLNLFYITSGILFIVFLLLIFAYTNYKKSLLHLEEARKFHRRALAYLEKAREHYNEYAIGKTPNE